MNKLREIKRILSLMRENDARNTIGIFRQQTPAPYRFRVSGPGRWILLVKNDPEQKLVRWSYFLLALGFNYPDSVEIQDAVAEWRDSGQPNVVLRPLTEKGKALTALWRAHRAYTAEPAFED